MGLKIRIGRETKQGYTRNISGLNMTDCYSYGLSALVALEFLRLNKAKSTGVEMGFCISALRQALFAKVKRDSHTPTRLPLGTRLWGAKSEMPDDLQEHPDLTAATGNLSELLNIWASQVKIETNQ